MVYCKRVPVLSRETAPTMSVGFALGVIFSVSLKSSEKIKMLDGYLVYLVCRVTIIACLIHMYIIGMDEISIILHHVMMEQLSNFVVNNHEYIESFSDFYMALEHNFISIKLKMLIIRVYRYIV